MKTQILKALRESEDYVSGQELCEMLHVSRTAVWKKIRQLQEEGYDIEAVTSRGYRIRSCPDHVSAEELQSRMQTEWIGQNVVFLETVDSTNQYAKRIAEENCPEGTLVAADEQTGGKGRSGRSWETPAGTNIAMTIVLRPQIPIERISMVTLVMGLAAAQAVRDLYKVDAGIKWPNDIVIGGKKLCGILTEMCSEITKVSYIVIGTGINANITQFPQPIRDTATSLKLELGEDVNRAQLIAQIMKLFEEYYGLFLKTQDLSLLQEQYNTLLVSNGRGVRVLEPENEYSGIAKGIDPMGCLLVEKEDGSITKVYAGEVSVRGIYGYV